MLVHNMTGHASAQLEPLLVLHASPQCVYVFSRTYCCDNMKARTMKINKINTDKTKKTCINLSLNWNAKQITSGN